MTKEEKIEEVLGRGVKKIYPSKKKLKEKMQEGKIRLYQGFDPTAPSLHIGHLAGIVKLAQFQKLGHEVIFLVGDFTGMIGDPTDKAETREKLTREEVLTNCKNYKKQAGRILSFSGENPAKLKFNSKWLDKVDFKELIEITSNFTVQQMIQRDFFQERLKKEEPIFLHEFLYPVAQAMDSLKMEVDLEVGGTDQTFNMLRGRDLLKKEKGKEKFVLTVDLLVDKQGKKVGKTTGNAVFLDLQAKEIYGRVMAFPDEVIIDGFKLLTLFPAKEIEKIKKELKAGGNPMKAKQTLAFEITKLVKGEKRAEEAEADFERVFKKDKKPKKIKEEKVDEEVMGIVELLVKTGLCSSKSEAKRMIKQKAVRVDGEKVKSVGKKVEIKKGRVLQVGKRKYRKVTCR